MKKIYINKTRRCLVFGNTMLLPGSQTVETIDERKFPFVKTFIENDLIKITDDAVSAIKDANTQKAVDDIAKMAKGDKNVQNAANQRKKVLDKIDEEVKEELNKKEESEEKG